MNPQLFLVSIIGFTIFMLAMAVLARRGADAETFFAAGRRTGTLGTAFATAIGWMWADVFFSTSQIGYDYGVYGLVWFAVPTALSFVLFAFIALRVRHDAPKVVTLPEFVALKTNDSRHVHVVMTSAIILYQLFVMGLNATITGFLLHASFGFDYVVSAASIVTLVLTYSLINGLKTSTYTGILQFFVVILLMGGLAVVLFMGADMNIVQKNALFGAEKAIHSAFDKKMVLALGIPLAIILLTQPLADQMIFQRLIALKKPSRIIRSFALTGILCGFGVAMFGSIGLLGLSLSQQGLIQVEDTQLAIVKTIGHYLSETGLFFFILAFFAVVFSTVDAVYCAISALFSYDVYQKYKNRKANDKQLVFVGRASMIGTAVIGILFSLAQFKILWMLFIVGVIGGSVVAPVTFAMLCNRLSGRHVSASIIISLIVSLPLSIYGNIHGDALLVSGASLASIAIGAIICAMGIIKK